MEMRLIKCEKKIWSNWMWSIFSWTLESKVNNSARRRYFKFRVYAVNMNRASLRYFSINARSWTSMLVAGKSKREIAKWRGRSYSNTYDWWKWELILKVYIQLDHTNAREILWPGIETRDSDYLHSTNRIRLKRSNFYQLRKWNWRKRIYFVREISSFLQMWEEITMPKIVRLKPIDQLVLIAWMTEPNTANELIQVKRMMLFHKECPDWFDHH